MIAAQKPGMRGGRVARNTLWNLIGSLLPIPAALACIPILASALGLERFGTLGIAWMVLGYFGLFDFGLSQSTARFAAAAAERTQQDGLRPLLINSLLLHAMLGLAGGLALAALAPWLAKDVLKVPATLSAETEAVFYWLAASVPVIVVTGAFRGALEGLQRFDLVNLIRVPAAIVNYVGPVLALPFGKDLPLVVAVIVVARLFVLIAYGAACLAVVPRAPAHLDGAIMKRLAAFGGWLTVSNLLNPLLISTDRFVIASTVSVAAVALYATPYEVVTKGWILSASLMGALFPALVALAERGSGSLRATCRAAEVYLAALAAPAIALLLGCADWLLYAWLGPEFRDGSTEAARLLAIGIFANIIAQVPLTALHAIGRADVTAKILAAEFPIYVAATWYFAGRFGIDGVAAVWAARAGVDAALLFAAANAVLPRREQSGMSIGRTVANIATLCFFLGAFWLAAFQWR
ncbi:MAG TPA: flippase, partial [Burkholderiales bacterium]|nr:flippase [Burkholderiales bacterium]